MTEPTADVIPLVQPGVEQPVKERKRDHLCFHRQFELDHESRRVYCSTCEAEVDAFAALDQIRRRWDRVASSLRELEAQERRLRVSVNDLKREERNARARKRKREAGL